jgi:hypothetical protein
MGYLSLPPFSLLAPSLSFSSPSLLSLFCPSLLPPYFVPLFSLLALSRTSSLPSPTGYYLQPPFPSLTSCWLLPASFNLLFTFLTFPLLSHLTTPPPSPSSLPRQPLQSGYNSHYVVVMCNGEIPEPETNSEPKKKTSISKNSSEKNSDNFSDNSSETPGTQ